MNEENRNEKEKYILAVDGGGSKTELYVSNLQGHKLCSIVVGSTSHKAVGKEKSFLNLQKGIKELQEAGIQISEIDYSVWGMSGCDSKVDQLYFHDLIQRLGFEKNKYEVCNDAIPAYYAQAQGLGMILIGGTGSIAYGITKEEKIIRLGGWGYGFSDCGGGYWIGNEVLKSTLFYADEQKIWDPLYDLVLAQSGADSFSELGNKIADIGNFSTVAQYAPLVFQLEDSLEGKRIIKEATKYMAELGAAMYRKLSKADKIQNQIILSGGLFGEQDYMQEFTSQFYDLTGLNSQKMNLLEQSPCVGGIKIAMKRLI